MSASDSDCSIDWLASDDEDHDSELELEPDYNRPAEGATILPEPASPRETRGSGDLQQLSKRSGNAYEMNAEKKGAEKEDNCSLDGLSSSCSSPSSCDGGEQGLPHPRVLERGGCPWGSDRNPKDIKRQAQKRPRGSAMPEERDRPTTQGQTEKDRLFACKCMELQCYIHPLSLILHGLRSGRYRERLSSFQESVALDRIQRIMGVLQNPCMGERYINIILKMEEMLKSWFPHIKPRDQHAPAEQNEGSNPAKKPRFSPAQPVGTPPTAGALPAAVKAMRASDLTPPGPYSATNLKWLHTSPICSPGTEQSQGGVRNFLTARGDRDLTQDNSVSSSTDTARAKLDSAPSRPPPGKINAPCLERLLKSTESIVNMRKGTGGLQGSGYS